jgi:4a-hydroxytetrahydrobiopterin dehydratase
VQQPAKLGSAAQSVALQAFGRQGGIMSADLAKESCVPCRGGGPSLSRQEALELLAGAPEFVLSDDARAITRRFHFPSFKRAIAFVNRMADLAEAEGHHPDFAVHYQKIDVELSTHDVGGLSRNDFILAAKLANLYQLVEQRPSASPG